MPETAVSSSCNSKTLQEDRASNKICITKMLIILTIVFIKISFKLCLMCFLL